MTQLGKDIKKPWRKWKFNNKRVIEVFERLEQKLANKSDSYPNRVKKIQTHLGSFSLSFESFS